MIPAFYETAKSLEFVFSLSNSVYHASRYMLCFMGKRVRFPKGGVISEILSESHMQSTQSDFPSCVYYYQTDAVPLLNDGWTGDELYHEPTAKV